MEVDRTAAAAALDGKVKLGGPQFQVVAPFRFRIEAEGGNRQQVAARCGIGKVENVLGRRQALVSVSRIAALVYVVAERKISRQPSRQIGADQSTRLYLARRVQRRRVYEYRAVADVAELGSASAVSVVCLWQPPDVMVARGFGVPVPDRNLVVEDLIRVVPHVLQPVEPKLRLIAKVEAVLRHTACAHLTGKVAHSH